MVKREKTFIGEEVTRVMDNGYVLHYQEFRYANEEEYINAPTKMQFRVLKDGKEKRMEDCIYDSNDALRKIIEGFESRAERGEF
jgi:hypothetical protein